MHKLIIIILTLTLALSAQATEFYWLTAGRSTNTPLTFRAFDLTDKTGDRLDWFRVRDRRDLPEPSAFPAAVASSGEVLIQPTAEQVVAWTNALSLSSVPGWTEAGDQDAGGWTMTTNGLGQFAAHRDEYAADRTALTNAFASLAATSTVTKATAQKLQAELQDLRALVGDLRQAIKGLSALAADARKP